MDYNGCLMQEIKSVQFGRVLSWLKKSTVKRIDTLGGDSFFLIKYENQASIMTIGVNGKFYYIDRTFWDRVCARMDELSSEERLKSSNYSTTRGWKNPSHIIAPNVPAICKAYFESE